MGREIERKFLVASDGWRPIWRAAGADSSAIRQVYLAAREGFSTRLRIIDDATAILTLKTGSGFSRGEFEYPVAPQDAAALEAAHIGIPIRKTRHRLPLGALTVEVDVFAGALAPLVLAEVELSHEAETFEPPDYFGREVTDDPGYSNARLALFGLPASFEGSD